MSENDLKLLGLMRRAGALVPGESGTGDTVRAGKAKLLLLAADASENAQKRAEGFLHGRRALCVALPYTKEEIASHVGLNSCSMAAVTDLGFADALMSSLAQQWPERYQADAEEIRRRLERAKRRSGKAAAERKKSIGKRRTNV